MALFRVSWQIPKFHKLTPYSYHISFLTIPPHLLLISSTTTTLKCTLSSVLLAFDLCWPWLFWISQKPHPMIVASWTLLSFTFMCGILILCALCGWKPRCIARKTEDLTDLMVLWWVTRKTCNPTLQVAMGSIYVGFPPRMNEIHHRTQSDHGNLDHLSLLISSQCWGKSIWPLISSLNTLHGSRSLHLLPFGYNQLVAGLHLMYSKYIFK